MRQASERNIRAEWTPGSRLSVIDLSIPLFDSVWCTLRSESLLLTLSDHSIFPPNRLNVRRFGTYSDWWKYSTIRWRHKQALKQRTSDRERSEWMRATLDRLRIRLVYIKFYNNCKKSTYLKSFSVMKCNMKMPLYFQACVRQTSVKNSLPTL